MSPLPWQVRLGRLSLKKRAKLATLVPLVLAWGDGDYLEVGPEKGGLAWELSRRRAGRFVHADGDESHLRSTRELTGDPVVAIDTLLPFADASFDGVLLVDHLEHVDDDRNLLAEVARVVRPGGPVIVSAPRLPSGFGAQLRRLLGMRRETYGHVRDGYTPEALSAMVREAGLTVGREGSCVGPGTETVELLLNAAFSLVGRLRGYRGGSKGHIAPQSREEAEGSRFLLAAYRIAFPILLALTLPDRLFPGRGSVLWVAARRQ